MSILFYLLSFLIALCGILAVILYVEGCSDKESFQTLHSQIPVFYINLDRSTDKQEKMENQLKLHFNNFQRISGVDGSKLHPNIYTNKINNNTSYNLKNFDGTIGRGNPSSVLGCLLSHIKTILLVDEKGYNNAVILEDDMDLQYYPKWNTTIENIINEAPDNWDIIKLFSLNESKLKDDVILFKKGIKYRKLPQNDIESEWSTGCYIINKRGVSQIMKDIQNNEFKIDKNKYKHLVADYYLYKNKNVYEYTKPLVAPFQNNKSEIDENGLNVADEKCAKFLKNFYSNYTH
jgi:GR25 family glycosyltransferase involved in LPS biosynthesis